jgi:excisionase family DNA binding protein
MPEDYLTVAEAAQKLSVSPRTIQRYCKQGRLNYKWVTGKRHKELRIVSPISVSVLPGVRQRKDFGALDYITRTDLEKATEKLTQQLLEKDHRIEELEHEVARLQYSLTQSPDTPKSPGVSESQDSLHKKASALLHDFEKVRPVEKKLILKIARELKIHEEFLRSLGME